MDIHKPKAAHSWRDFLIEIGTIICGILIALGLEQAVEAAHRATEVREARDALHDEIATDAAIAAISNKEDVCLANRMDAYDAWAHGGTRPAIEYGVALLSLRSSTWETVKTGAVTHMPLKERLALAQFYDWVADHQKIVDREREASMGVHTLWARERLDPNASGRLLEAVKRTRNLTDVRTINSNMILASAEALRVQPDRRLQNPSLLAKVCNGATAPQRLGR